MTGASIRAEGVEPARPADCLPEAVVAWSAALPSPELRFGAGQLPGIVLGPPGDSSPLQGSLTVASLGHGGSATLTFRDVVIVDGPGPDLIVFENAFFVGTVPASPTDLFTVFVEPAFVEVSADGATWLAFPHDPQALDESRGSTADRDLFLRLQGLAGVTPTFTGNWTVPDAAAEWDGAGTGGISGAGGDAFDLATVGLTEARHVRLTDADTRNGPAGSGEGFDLDAVVVLNGRPVPPLPPDADGDGLTDAGEMRLYLTDPGRRDHDGDGADDGSEISACRDAASTSSLPAWSREPSLTLHGGASCTEIRWTFGGTGTLTDVIRGDVYALAAGPGGDVDLGDTLCLADDAPGVSGPCEADAPSAGGTWFYLARHDDRPGWGWSGSLAPRVTPTGCP